LTKATKNGKLDELLDLENPLALLPPVARNLLQAARRLLDRGGFEALRLQAIATEAGEAKGSIAYYFGNKAGLMAALVDYLAHDANLAVIRATESLPIGEARIHALIDGETRISSDLQDFRAFFEILPHALRDDDLRPRVARLYDGYRETVLRCLGATDDRERKLLLPHAMLMLALVDGLAIQHALDPGNIDISVATRLWEELLKIALDSGRPV
jgi:TetR/AcrR family transcriptional repressor of bet genes